LRGERKVNKSESIKNLTKALSQFQGEVQNPKNTANNPYFNSKYAPLQEVLNIVRPLLTKHGLAIIQSPSGDGKNVSITTILSHESGEWIEFEPLILNPEKTTPQGIGSAITYGRRYSLSAALGIASEDDDGNEASKPNEQQSDNCRTATYSTSPQKKQPTANDTERKKFFANLQDWAKQNKFDWPEVEEVSKKLICEAMKVDSRSKLTPAQWKKLNDPKWFEALCNNIKKKLEEKRNGENESAPEV